MTHEPSAGVEVRLSEALLWACALSLPLGVIDAAFGLARAPDGTSLVVGGLAVLLLHPAIAVLLVVVTWPALRAFGTSARVLLATWLRAAPGGPEATRTVVLLARATLLLVAVLVAAVVGAALLGDIQTALYVALGQTLLGGGALALAWGAGGLLARRLDDIVLPLPGLSRLRLVAAAALLALALYGFLWVERDLVLKELDPWGVLGLLLHVVVPLAAVTLPGAIRANATTTLVALALLPLALVVGSLSAAGAVLSVYAPVAGRVTHAVAPLSDFDDDGRSWLFGGADCGPFDPMVYPGAPEKLADGVDQDCDGEDLAGPEEAVQQLAPLPEAERAELIVVISVDSLRQDHVGVYGGGALTPNIDRFAERAVVFENAYSSATVTLAAIPGLWTGRATTELYRHMKARHLDNQLPTLPEVLKPAGFTSGMVVDSISARRHGWERGFDTQVDLIGAKRERADEIVDLALTWLDEHKDGKRLLWVHVFDPHAPYHDVPELDLGAGRTGRYAEGVQWMDRHVGRLLERLEGEDATVVFVADHGEHLGEGGLLAHGKDIYGPAARIPLLIRAPWSAPRRVKTAVWQLDLFSTLSHLAGVAAPKSRGRSLVPELKGAPDDLDRVVFTEAYYGYDWIGASTARHRLLYAAHANSYELYDVEADGSESKNLYAAGTEVSDLMRRHIARFVATVRDPEGEAEEARTERATIEAVPDEALLSTPARLGDDVEVLGYQFTRSGKQHFVDVYMRANRQLTRSFRVEVILEKEGKTLKSATFPGKGRFPTHRWPPGAIVMVRLNSKLGRADPKGWNVTVAFVDATDATGRLVARPDPLPPRSR